MKTTQTTKISNLDQLAKAYSFEFILKCVEKEIKNKEYHKARNQKIKELIHRAKEMGL